MYHSEFKETILVLGSLIDAKRKEARNYIAIDTDNAIEARANLGIAERLHGEIIDLEQAIFVLQKPHPRWRTFE